METLPKIIVLDDEPELRNMLQRFLSTQGFEVRVVENGKRLDRYLQREPYDLLVLDWMMEPKTASRSASACAPKARRCLS